MKTRSTKTRGPKARNMTTPSAETKGAETRECRAIFAALSEFVDGTLPARNCRELRRHLSGCKPCVEYLESLKTTIRLCHAYQTAPAPPPSPAVREAFMKALSKTP
jgi:anti-sigma factor RsiW